MGKFEKFIESILKAKAKITNASKGTEFEDNIKGYLKKNGISEMSAGLDEEFDKYIQEIKPKLQEKTGSTLMENDLYKTTKNAMYKDCFRWQPYGSQDYPDFIIFTENKIFSMETKFSTKSQKKPMWNSNLPKMDGIYVFGSYDNKELTVFRGEDVLPNNEREKLVSIWKDIEGAFELWEKDFKKEISLKTFSNEYGFSPYVRRAYSQGKQYNETAKLDFFNSKERLKLEQSARKFISDNDK